MIKNGALLLKKHNFLSLLILFLILLLSACKTIPVGRLVDPIELLDNDSVFYIAIPKNADSVLINRIIKNNIKNLSESDANLITGKVNKVYCGLIRSKNVTSVQASIDAEIPTGYIPKVMTSKNGFSSKGFKPVDSTVEYKIYSNNGIYLAFPSSNICCLGRNIDTMLTKFDTLSKLPAEDIEIYSDLAPELIDYLKDAEDEIRFYANKPQSFLTILTGAQLDLKLIDVKGSFVTDPKHNDQYLLDLDFQFKNPTYLKAGKGLLTLAFGLTNSQSEIYNENCLKITGIKLDKKQLYKLLVL